MSNEMQSGLGNGVVVGTKNESQSGSVSNEMQSGLGNGVDEKQFTAAPEASALPTGDSSKWTDDQVNTYLQAQSPERVKKAAEMRAIMNTNPDDYSPEKRAVFNSDEYENRALTRKELDRARGVMTQVNEDKKVSQASALGAGVRQGITLGFNDEITAWISSLFGEDYQRARDGIRESNTRAREQNPKTYLGGEIVGSLINPGVAGSIRAGTTVAKAAGGSAAVGAASGFGHSDAPTLEGQLIDTGIGATIGGVVGAAGTAIGNAIGGVGKKLADETARKASTLNKSATQYARKVAESKTQVQNIQKAIANEERALKFTPKIKPLSDAQKALGAKAPVDARAAINAKIDKLNTKLKNINAKLPSSEAAKKAVTAALRGDKVAKEVAEKLAKGKDAWNQPFKNYIQEFKKNPMFQTGLLLTGIKPAVALAKGAKAAIPAIATIPVKVAAKILKKITPKGAYNTGLYLERLLPGLKNTKYGPYFESLIKKSLVQAGVAHLRLLETDPKYRKKIQKEIKDQNWMINLIFKKG